MNAVYAGSCKVQGTLYNTTTKVTRIAPPRGVAFYGVKTLYFMLEIPKIIILIDAETKMRPLLCSTALNSSMDVL